MTQDVAAELHRIGTALVWIAWGAWLLLLCKNMGGKR